MTDFSFSSLFLKQRRRTRKFYTPFQSRRPPPPPPPPLPLLALHCTTVLYNLRKGRGRVYDPATFNCPRHFPSSSSSSEGAPPKVVRNGTVSIKLYIACSTLGGLLKPVLDVKKEKQIKTNTGKSWVLFPCTLSSSSSSLCRKREFFYRRSSSRLPLPFPLPSSPGKSP